jgi:hypothetical protein
MKRLNDTKTPSVEKLYRGITNWLRLLPDFLIVGTQRGGTTSLYSYLVSHPSIEPASIKEVHFFDNKFTKGVAWYRAHFPSLVEKYYAQHVQQRNFITGESTPYYLFHPHVPKRVARVVPHARLIVLLRNPVDRAYSQYNHEVDGGRETVSTFEEAIEREEERLAREHHRLLANEYYVSYEHRHHSYLAKGIYVNQLRNWMSCFPRNQFLILRSEDFYANPAAALQQTLAFLHLPTAPLSSEEQEYKQYNNKTFTKMNPGTRQRLIAYFQPYNEQLYEYLGRDFGWNT